nr:MAG TPA: hypothetical protein [Caudoviricetes sp.]
MRRAEHRSKRNTSLLHLSVVAYKFITCGTESCAQSCNCCSYPGKRQSHRACF